MLRRPEVLAWVVMGASFAVFCLIAAAIFVAVLWYRGTATFPRDARLTIISGTVLVRGDKQPVWISATPEMAIKEGDTLKTDATAQALVTLFDKSTVILFSGTELQISRLASTRFEPKRHSIVLFQERGKTHIGVAPMFDGEKHFELDTPQAKVLLNEGSFSIKVDNTKSQLRVQERGKAVVMAGDGVAELKDGQRVEITTGSKPSSPQEAKEELIFNGDFSQGLTGWQTGNMLGFPEGQDVQGEVAVTMDEGRPVLHFSRKGSKGAPCQTYIYQDIDKDVSDLSNLTLSVKFKLLYQSLSGGGFMGSEYPILVRLDYRGLYGEEFTVYGFYYQNEANNRTDNGVLVPQDTWVSYTVPRNLMALIPQPRQIISIQISGSGWDYESLLGEVSLVGE